MNKVGVCKSVGDGAGTLMLLSSQHTGLSLSYNPGKGIPPTVTFISSISKNGVVYSFEIFPNLFHAIFGRKPRWDKNSSVNFCALVICDSGQVIAVCIQDDTSLYAVQICRVVEAVVWAGALSCGERSVLMLVKRSGTLLKCCATLLTKNEPSSYNSLNWAYEDLKCMPIACCSCSDMLLLSDGIKCWLWTFHLDGMKLNSSFVELVFCGVIKFWSHNDNVKFYINNGVSFTEKWLNLKTFIHKESINKSEHFRTLHKRSIPKMMKILQRCSKLMEKERIFLKSMNGYYDHVVLLQRIVAKSLDKYFIINTYIEPNHNKDSYAVRIELTYSGNPLPVVEDWWQLRISSSNSSFIKYTYANLKDISSPLKLNVMLDIPTNVIWDIMQFHGQQFIYIRCDLILKKYTFNKPLCSIKVSETKIDLIKFLCLYKMQNSYYQIEYCFKTTKNCNIDKNNKPSSQVAMYCDENSLSNVHIMGCDILCDSKTSSTKLLWLLDCPVQLSVDYLIKNDVKLLLKSVNVCAILALKHSIYNSIFDVKKERIVTIRSNMLNMAYLSRNLLDSKESISLNSHTIVILHDAINQMISSLPL